MEIRVAGTRLRSPQLSVLLCAVFSYFWLRALAVVLHRCSLVAKAEGDELTVVSYVSRCNGLVWRRRAPSREHRSLYAKSYRFDLTTPRRRCRLHNKPQHMPNLEPQVAVLSCRNPALTDEPPQRLLRIALSSPHRHGVSAVVRSGVAEERKNRPSLKPYTSRPRTMSYLMVAGGQYRPSWQSLFLATTLSPKEEVFYSEHPAGLDICSQARHFPEARVSRLCSSICGVLPHKDLVGQLVYSLTIILHYAYPTNSVMHIRGTQAYNRPLEPLNFCGGSEERCCEVHEVSHIF